MRPPQEQRLLCSGRLGLVGGDADPVPLCLPGLGSQGERGVPCPCSRIVPSGWGFCCIFLASACSLPVLSVTSSSLICSLKAYLLSACYVPGTAKRRLFLVCLRNNIKDGNHIFFFPTFLECWCLCFSAAGIPHLPPPRGIMSIPPPSPPPATGGGKEGGQETSMCTPSFHGQFLAC